MCAARARDRSPGGARRDALERVLHGRLRTTEGKEGNLDLTGRPGQGRAGCGRSPDRDVPRIDPNRSQRIKRLPAAERATAQKNPLRIGHSSRAYTDSAPGVFPRIGCPRTATGSKAKSTRQYATIKFGSRHAFCQVAQPAWTCDFRKYPLLDKHGKGTGYGSYRYSFFSAEGVGLRITKCQRRGRS